MTMWQGSSHQTVASPTYCLRTDTHSLNYTAHLTAICLQIPAATIYKSGGQHRQVGKHVDGMDWMYSLAASELRLSMRNTNKRKTSFTATPSVAIMLYWMAIVEQWDENNSFVSDKKGCFCLRSTCHRWKCLGCNLVWYDCVLHGETNAEFGHTWSQPTRLLVTLP